jgi:hypothetical protein
LAEGWIFAPKTLAMSFLLALVQSRGARPTALPPAMFSPLPPIMTIV